MVFARLPRLGQGKRRLAAGIGAVGAWRFARLTLAGTLRRLGRDPRWRLVVAVTPDRGAAARGWPEGAEARVAQGGGDLGMRMARALRAQGRRGPVVLIGSDIPGLRATHIAAAFRALRRADLVFGPATDGGYWLVGVRHAGALPRDAFAGVRWSTPHALADTLAGLPQRCRVALADRRDDVDDADDFRRLRGR